MKHVDVSDYEIMPGAGMKTAAIIALVVGLIGLGASFGLGLRGESPTGFLHSYLLNFVYFMSLALGAFFFVFIQHLVSAGWSVVVRRLAEMIMSVIPVMAILAIPIILGRNDLFMWLRPEAATDALVQTKVAYLNSNAFIIRMVVYFVLWGGLSAWFLGRSLKQDETGDFRITMGLKKLAAPTTIIFALSVTLFAVDMIMSLDAHWFSTMFGVYYFSGSALGAFALLAIVTYLTQRSGKLTRLVTADHYHDIGKLMFGFTVFWAYIAFSQFMLIWYANIPEETAWFLKRTTGEWLNMSWFLLVGHFALPFFALISRVPKRRPHLLIWPALWILFVHWIDLFWLIKPEMPGVAAGTIPWAVTDITCFIGIGGIFVAAGLFRARNHALIPRQDPRLPESLAFQNVGG